MGLAVGRISGQEAVDDVHAGTRAQTRLTFDGSTSVTIPKGGDVYSDPVTLTFAITAGQPVLVSLWIENPSVSLLPGNGWDSGGYEFWSPAGSGSVAQVEDTTGDPFTETGSGWDGGVDVLTGLDVTTPAFTSTTQGSAPGAPTVVVAGDGIIDGFGSDAMSDALNSPSERVAGQLYSQGLATGFGPVDAGVEANQVMADAGSLGFGGVSLIARLDHDILAEPDVGTVILNEGLQDLLRNPSVTSTQLQNALWAVTQQLTAFGISVIVATLTPCNLYTNADYDDSCSSAVDATRMAVNGWLTGKTSLTAPTCVSDFDAAVSNNASPTESLATSPADFDSGDHANLSWAGYAAEAQAVPTEPPASPLAGSSCSLYASSQVMPDP